VAVSGIDCKWTNVAGIMNSGSCARSARRGKGVGRDRAIDLPARELDLVPQPSRVVQIHGADHARQLVVGADPDLGEHPVVGDRNHVRRRAT